MSYSNDQTQIKAGLVNYIGSLLKASIHEGSGARHNVIAILSEQILKLGKDENDKVDMYSMKPLLRATNITLAKHCADLQSLNNKEENVKIEQLKQAILILTDLIELF